MARGTFLKEFLDSTPSEPALSNPTNAKIASTVPTRMPPGLTPVRLSWWVSMTPPLCTQMFTHSMRMIVTEIDSRISAVLADRPISRNATPTAMSVSTRKSATRIALLSPGAPSRVRKSAPKIANP